MRLENKIAIITGGVQGIGLATAKLFAREGATVLLWDVNASKGASVLEELATNGSENGAKAEFYTVNVADAASVQATVAQIVAKYGRIDILINNAGITRDASLLKMTPEQWQQVLDVNLTGVFVCTQAVAPQMIAQTSGRIINASSIAGIYGNYGQVNYAATKAAVIGMTKTLAKELGRKGITVNAVAPGFIATEMVGTIPENVVKSMHDRTPLGRAGTPEDVAKAYLFLASDDASFITGAVLGVDGGLAV